MGGDEWRSTGWYARACMLPVPVNGKSSAVMIVDEDGAHVERFIGRAMAPTEARTAVLLCNDMAQRLERVVNDHSRRRRERCSTN